MKMLLIFVCFLAVSALNSSAEPQITLLPMQKTSLAADDKAKVFTILEAKCNICHRMQKAGKIFTLENMEGFAKRINKEVFDKKRMPKGDIIKLTEKESEQLKAWVDATLVGNK